MSGILNLNKPSGLTSRQVVDRVQRLARPAKAGHAGTLDPLASGVLVVCVGAATRLIQYVQQMPKRYTAEFLLGRESPTDDVEGELTEWPDLPIPDAVALGGATAQFVGRIEQRPPTYSAIKIGGRRAYDLARRGQQVELKARPVDVYGIDLIAYDYPRLTLDVRCGGGTYIRSLGRDLAESLGTKAVMSTLTRTAVGDFRVEDALELERLAADGWARKLQPPVAAVSGLPQVSLAPDQVTAARHGRQVELAAAPVGATEVAGVDSSGNLVAILTPRNPGRRSVYHPSRVLPE